MAGITEQGKSRVQKQPAGIKGVVSFSASFESNEQGAVFLYFPFAVKVTKIRSVVTKALANTDAGTIQGANATGNSTGGLITHALSAAIGNEQSATPTTNNTVAKDSYYKLTTAKSTAGGKVHGTVEYVTR